MACSGPSLLGAFDILSAAGQAKLLHLKHKLRARRPGGQGAGLLHAMVQLQLGQQTEARASLDALKDDAVARLVARQWAGVSSPGDSEQPGEPDVCWTVARLYHLLAEEELCPAGMRDAAYRAALQALSSTDDPRLARLRDEAQDRCGWDLIGDPSSFGPLRSDLGRLPPCSVAASGTRSLPRPIESPSGWSRGRPLRSAGTPGSLDCHLEISQSPTVALSSLHRSPPGPGRHSAEPPASEVPDAVPPGRQEPEEMSWPPSTGPDLPPSPVSGQPEQPPDPASAGLPESPVAALEVSAHYPVECTEVLAAPDSLPAPTLEPTGTPGPAKQQVPLQESVGDRAPPQNTRPRPPAPSSPRVGPLPPPSSSPSPSPSPSAPSPSSASEQKFYSFVVLHAKADEDIAVRVRDKLEALGVPDGATFCEDFQVPGRGELRCLQDAIDHSAFIIFLLTPSFDCRLGLHQVSQALMSTLTRLGWQDCVIPFLPRESSKAQLGSDAASLLAGLVWLEERSQLFARKVANTFKAATLRDRKSHWQREQVARALREQSQHLEAQRQWAAAMDAAASAYVQNYLSWQAQVDRLQAAFGSHVSLGAAAPPGAQGPLGAPPPFSTWPGHPQPPPPPLPLPPPLGPWQAGLLPGSPAPPPSPGLQPLIIHHAQMVQLGLNNHMWNRRGAQGPEDEPRPAE